MEKDISIIILTYNAPSYVKETLDTLYDITSPEDLARCEVIVWDNASSEETKQLLKEAQKNGQIDRLFFSDRNLLFAGGNNAAVKLATTESKYYLLLNSDICIKDPNWLKYLLQEIESKNYAGVSYGHCGNPSRCDGYCFIIKKELYDKYQLDENYQWWWSLTKLQAQVLREGKSLLAYKRHNHIIKHYGGKSGDAFKSAKGMDTEVQEVKNWFKNSSGKVKTKYALTNGNILKYFAHGK